MQTASRLKRIKPSPTLAVSAKATEMKAQGIDVISLGAGEPDFDTPESIKKAAIAAIERGETKYTPVDGTKALKEAVVNKYARENNLTFSINEVTIGAGGKQVIFNLMLVSLEPGDEVIIPAPYWVSYLDIVNFAEGAPVVVACPEQNNFKLTAQLLESAITPKTKWLFLNSPSNPSGAGYSADELKALADVLLKHEHVNIMSDDIYEHVVYDGFKCINILEVEPRLRERTFLVNGVSKAYSMTGWRIGYGVGRPELIKAISMLQSQSTTNPSSISQAAAVAALNGPQDFIPVNNETFRRRRDFVVSALNQIDGITCKTPEGAFYVFPSMEGLVGRKTKSGRVINNCSDFAELLLEQAHVAVVPGIGFGMENYFRISYATSDANLQKALARIADFVSSLS